MPANEPSHQPTAPLGPPPRKNKIGTTLGLIALGVVLVIVALVVFHSSSNGPNPKKNAPAPAKVAPAQVNVTRSGFVPATVSIKVGQAVNWTNTDASPHWVASDPYPTDDSLPGLNARQNMGTNQSFSYVFDRAGTYKYHDNLNPYSFHGEVIVQ